MDSHAREAAIHVMQELSHHPVSGDFSEPFQPGDDEQNYFEVIRNPQDLSTITKRLEAGEYKSVQAWLEDVEAVWANAETFHGYNSTMGVLAREGRRLFAKYCIRFYITSPGTWCREIARLKTRICDLLGQPPPRMKAFAPNAGNGHVAKQVVAPLTEEELDCLVQASQMMTTDEEQEGMVQCISEIQPDLDLSEMGVVLDVTKLELETLYALREYLRATLEKRNEKYPESAC